jgi:uncharacterized protein YrrD
MKLVRAEELIGRPVVAIETGENLAELRDVVYDATSHELVGFTLSGAGPTLRRSRLRPTLAARSVESIGPDAVMVRNPAALAGADDETGEPDTAEASTADQPSASSDPAEPDLLRSGHPVVGRPVLDASGQHLGEIVSVILDIDDTPRAIGYELRVHDREGPCFVPISAQIAVSSDNVVLREDAGDLLRSDLDGLSSEFSSPPADDGGDSSS